MYCSARMLQEKLFTWKINYRRKEISPDNNEINSSALKRSLMLATTEQQKAGSNTVKYSMQKKQIGLKWHTFFAAELGFREEKQP